MITRKRRAASSTQIESVASGNPISPAREFAARARAQVPNEIAKRVEEQALREKEARDKNRK
ncbi:MAG: hypothetical protein U1E76_13995 [Planctomycetota bacterium]